MTTEINVISRTQVILVDPTSGSVSVINAGPPGPAGPSGGGGTLTIPPGVMMPFPTTVIPSGWLLCDGAVYNNTQYPALAAVLGSLYGGNGTSTFAVPNLRGKTIFGHNPAAPPFNTFGQSLGALSHYHPLNDKGFAQVTIQAANAVNTIRIRRIATSNWSENLANAEPIGFGGYTAVQATGAGLGGRTEDSGNVIPPGIVLNYIIKT